ncbi:MAG: GatB/YqeY domain-containing protein [Candidatus Buchananbacteria bacterium]|nr:GatB/YqeY domain-containing protein [Candidatus Buchananbacteria bacterium]
MSILNQIEKDYEQAFKAKEQNVVSTLRMLLAALKNEKIKKKGHLTDEDIIKVIKSETKKRKEAIEEYNKADRQELASLEAKELEILKQYLPEQMSEEMVRQKVKEILKEISDKENIGKVMGSVMPQLKGMADGALVKQIVEEEINK